MVCKIVCGKSIRGVLNYNEYKVQCAAATLLLAAGFPRGPEELTFSNKLQMFEMLTRQNEKTGTNTLHITLNFSPKDEVDDDKLKLIAMDYMNRIGFGSQPFLVYRHYDAAHAHIHIATVNITQGGARIETHNIGRNQSEKARKEIEEWYGLVRAEDQQKEMAYLLRPAKLQKAVYGKRETKATISAIVRDVVSSYKFASLPELNAVLRQFNVMAYPGAEGTVMREKGGLVYCMLNDQGEAIGIPIKASSIYGSPTLKSLEQKYKPNEAARKPYGQRLKHLLDKGLSGAADLNEVKEKLHRQGIRIVVRENAQGHIYGLTFIDNATRCVFNGSNLGKVYSAKAFMERLPTGSQNNGIAIPVSGQQTGTAAAAEIEEKLEYPAQERPVIETLRDTMPSDTKEDNMPDPFRKKRRRLQAE